MYYKSSNSIANHSMKRTRLQRRTSLRAKQPWRPKRTPLRQKGTSPTAEAKENIQALLRDIVILRDGGCILRNIRHCSDLVLQCDHLITRANSATYADSRLCVCVCRSCHGWKSMGSNRNKQQYDAIVRTLLPPDRVELWDRCEAESWRPTRKGSYDWRLEDAALRQELATLKQGIKSDGMPLAD
jgi:hypothetical protein